MLENTDGKKYTVSEYRERIKENQTDKHDRLVGIYTADAEKQHTNIAAADRPRLRCVESWSTPLTRPSSKSLEQKEDKMTFVRVDSATPDQLVQKDEEKENLLSEDETTTVKYAFQHHRRRKRLGRSQAA